MATPKVPSGRNIQEVSQVDLTTEAGNTLYYRFGPNNFIGTTKIEIQMVFDSANANANTTEVTAFNSLVDLGEIPSSEGKSITDGTSLEYTFVNGNEILAEEIETSTLEWLYLRLDVNGAADAGTLQTFIKTKQN